MFKFIKRKIQEFILKTVKDDIKNNGATRAVIEKYAS